MNDEVMKQLILVDDMIDKLHDLLRKTDSPARIVELKEDLTELYMLRGKYLYESSQERTDS